MQQRYNYAFFDEASKREIRRALVKGVSIPGYQVPFASREMPIGRGWGTGGLQITLAIIGPDDTLKVIDQGSDDSVNAVNIKKLVVDTTDVEVTDATEDATLIQSRHRIPEHPLDDGQILVLQVPTPEPLRSFEPSEAATKRLHAEADYTGAWLELFDQIVRYDAATTGADHPVQVFGRYVMAPSPIPRFDNLKLNQARHLTLLGAGREKKIYAVPPFTDVKPLDFEDYPFAVETFEGKCCRLCGAEGVYLDELVDEATGETYYQCNDTNYCASSACQPTKPVDAAAASGTESCGSKSFSRPEGRHLGLSPQSSAPEASSLTLRTTGDRGFSCGNCSNCAGEFESMDVTDTALAVMRCVQELRGRFGKGMVVDVLRGSQNAKLLDMHLDEAACYDTVNAPAAQVKEVIELLAAGGYLLITEGTYPVVGLGPRAREAAEEGFSLSMKRVLRKPERTRSAAGGSHVFGSSGAPANARCASAWPTKRASLPTSCSPMRLCAICARKGLQPTRSSLRSAAWALRSSPVTAKPSCPR